MAQTKDELEAQKLELEVRNLSKPFHRTPTFWLSATTTVLAIVATVGQSYISKIDRQQAQIDRDLAILAKEKTERDLAELAERRRSVAEQVSQLNEQLDAIRVNQANVEKRLTSLVEAATRVPASSASAELHAAKAAAERSLLSVELFALQDDQEALLHAVRDDLNSRGFSIREARVLRLRPAWLSFSETLREYKAAVTYCGTKTQTYAKEISELAKVRLGTNVDVVPDDMLSCKLSGESKTIYLFLQ